MHMPVPYVDASGSSAFARKGQRAQVAAAGMLTELLLAALAQGGTVALDPRVTDQPRALNRVFQFDLQLPPGARGALLGQSAYVRFFHADEPPGLQGWRRLRQLLLSRLTP